MTVKTKIGTQYKGQGNDFTSFSFTINSIARTVLRQREKFFTGPVHSIHLTRSFRFVQNISSEWDTFLSAPNSAQTHYIISRVTCKCWFNSNQNCNCNCWGTVMERPIYADFTICHQSLNQKRTVLICREIQRNR